MKRNSNGYVVEYAFVLIITIFFMLIVLRIICAIGKIGPLKVAEKFSRNVYCDVQDAQYDELVRKTNFIRSGNYSLTEKVEAVKDIVRVCAIDFFPERTKIVEISNKIDEILGWKIVSYSEYNGVLKVEEQYLSSISAEIDVTDIAESVIDLANYCEDLDIDFIYIQQPGKICKFEDSWLVNSIDFSNKNMDNLVELLRSNGVDVYDHRVDIHKEGLCHHDLFYGTDHHWKAETGLWASEHILRYLVDNYGYAINADILKSDNYSYDVRNSWFLGSQGKKVMLDVVDPENITLIYPKYDTYIHYRIPELCIDEYGEFDITYDMKQVEQVDYYNLNPYAAYNHADCSLIEIDNELIAGDVSALIIHKSFANCEIPFLAMGIKHIDAIDLRHFEGSTKQYIYETKPNIVIVTYDAALKSEIDWSSKRDVFDFR